MRKDVHKVSEQEYKLVQQIRNLKEKGFTDDEILQLDRNKEVTQENKQKLRISVIRKNDLKIIQYERMITDKLDQIHKKDYREKSESFFDDKKPEFMLLNEIDELTELMEDIKETNKITQEEHDKDK